MLTVPVESYTLRIAFVGWNHSALKVIYLSIYLCVVSNDVDDHSAPKFSVLCTVYYRIICP